MNSPPRLDEPFFEFSKTFELQIVKQRLRQRFSYKNTRSFGKNIRFFGVEMMPDQ